MIAIEPITPKNAMLFKTIRLRALRDAPTAFGSTHADESQRSDADWLNRAAQCASPTSIGYLAMDGEMPCGLARAAPDDRDLAVAWVESMWVAPSHRRLGVGRSLVEKIIAWARSQHLRTLKLSVTSNNESAIHFYRALGFSPAGKTEPYPNDPALIECEMSQQVS